MLTPPSAYAYNGSPYSHQHHQGSSGKSPSKRFSLQKYYYGRNTMISSASASRMTPSRTPSPPLHATSPWSPTLASPSVLAPAPTALSSSSQSIPASPSRSASLSSFSPPSPISLSSSPSTLAYPSGSNSFTIPERTAATSGCTGMMPATAAVCMPKQGSNAGSLSILIQSNFSQPSSITSTSAHHNNDRFVANPSSSQQSRDIDMPSKTRQLSPPKLTTIMATPTSPSLPPSLLSSSPLSDSYLTIAACSYPSPSSPVYASSPPSSTSPTLDYSHHNAAITSPEPSAATPFPARSISSSTLAQMLEQSSRGIVNANSRRPLILDLRPHPDFYPISIVCSININLPTLLMKRYRRGVAISSFSLESFITMPSDKDLYDQIQESWRTNATSSLDEPHDIIVLDQVMKAGDEAYGRSATAAWTLLNVLERGIGNSCFGGAPIRLWYLEGGFEAFQTWDVGEKYLTRPGFSASLAASSDVSTIQEVDHDVEMTLAAPTGTTKPSLAIDTSVVLEPRKGPIARRESLFSLNTKSLQRPAGLPRSQTVSLKPLAIPSGNSTSNQNQQQSKGWLAVPSGMAASALSPAMSVMSNHSMEISHSASTDHSSGWSADACSVNGSGHFPAPVPTSTLSSKRSMSSLLTLNSVHASSTTASIREEDEHSSNSGSGSRILHVSCDNHQWDNQSYKDGLSRSRSGSFQTLYSSQHADDSFNADQEEENFDDGEQEISCIIPNFLYLGPEIVHQSQVEELERLGVKRVLNMANECDDVLICDRDGIEYHKIGVYDHIEADVGAGMMKAVEIIAAASDSPIYVHCKAGKSRSVTATIAYLITRLQWPLSKAYQHVLTQRPCMCPNIGFVTELMLMEERTLGADKAGGLVAA
ncbi:hypothetical protein BGZ99_008464 [Dissophora globulifera]|uniref:protein-tyrosine-phosphatase n=1 Tax=Dissophora globulifera TaxID=979702 RepID=A0A9P6R9L3_9FUNG|nr:hypothetical protein BGZ99_008464 [Dissophora globulifera]